MEKYISKWHKSAWGELKSIYEHYKEKSVQGAENVRDDILAGVDKLVDHPEVNRPFDQSLGKPYRYINVRRYKVIHIKENDKKEIRVLGIFDTKQSPQKIQKIRRRKIKE